MKVVDFLFVFSLGIGVVAYLRQGFVGIWIGVDIGISAVRLDFLQEVAAAPNKSGFFFEAVFVVDEAGKGKRIGQGRLKVISDNLDILLGLDPTYAC